MQWNDGDVAYDQLQLIFVTSTKHMSLVYVHGSRRQQFLERMIGRSVINLEDLRCPKSSKLVFPANHCAYRHHQFHTFRCPLYEARCYSKYLAYYDLAQYATSEPKHVYNTTPTTPSPNILHDDDED